MQSQPPRCLHKYLKEQKLSIAKRVKNLFKVKRLGYLLNAGFNRQLTYGTGVSFRA